MFIERICPSHHSSGDFSLVGQLSVERHCILTNEFRRRPTSDSCRKVGQLDEDICVHLARQTLHQLVDLPNSRWLHAWHKLSNSRRQLSAVVLVFVSGSKVKCEIIIFSSKKIKCDIAIFSPVKCDKTRSSSVKTKFSRIKNLKRQKCSAPLRYIHHKTKLNIVSELQGCFWYAFAKNTTINRKLYFTLYLL